MQHDVIVAVNERCWSKATTRWSNNREGGSWCINGFPPLVARYQSCIFQRCLLRLMVQKEICEDSTSHFSTAEDSILGSIQDIFYKETINNPWISPRKNNGKPVCLLGSMNCRLGCNGPILSNNTQLNTKGCTARLLPQLPPRSLASYFDKPTVSPWGILDHLKGTDKMPVKVADGSTW